MRLRTAGCLIVAGLVHFGAACGSDADSTGGAPSQDNDGGGGSGVDGATAHEDGAVASDGGSGVDASQDADGIDAGPYTGPRAVSIAASDTRACALLETGALRCWGAGKSTPETITPGTSYKRVALGRASSGTTCAIRNDDTLWCFSTGAPTPVQVGSATYTGVAIGNAHRCAVATDGTLWCWGDNNQGQLGTGDYAAHAAPTQVGTDTDWDKVGAGESHSCALKKSGALFCWGSSSAGSDGLASTTPLAIFSGSTFTDLALSGIEECAVRSDGALFCGYGVKPAQIGAETSWTRGRPSSTGNTTQHRCGLQSTGAIRCWGYNGRGQLGDGKTTQASPSTPAQVPALDWTDLATGNAFTCGIRTDGSVRCWGAASAGQLGAGGLTSPRTTPSTPVGGTWSMLFANQGRTCGVRTDGSVACWGGAIAATILSLNDQQTPAEVSPASAGPWAEAAIGLYHACLRKSDGTLACWGDNSFGEVGVGPSPTVVSAPTAIGLTGKGLGVGYQHTCAIGATSALYCWGTSTYNRLGFTVAGNAAVNTPTVSGSDTWVQIASTFSNNCGVRTDGKMVCWGYSFTGFEALTADTTWTAVTTTPNDNQYYGIKANVAYAWSGNGANHSIAALGGATNWKTIAGNFQHQCGVRTDGTLACLGGNAAGELGDGSTTNRLTAVQVGVDADWTQVAVGYSHTCGMRAGGTVYCWGANGSGEIGDGSAWSLTARLVLL